MKIAILFASLLIQAAAGANPQKANTGRSATLDSVASPTKLPLPLPIKPTILKSPCFTEAQIRYGPTVDQWGNGLYYGPKENVSYRTDKSATTQAIWRQPGIEFADGKKCCDQISEVRDSIDYIDQTILEYLAIRQQFVLEAGRFKESKEAVRAVPRAIDVIKHAQSLGQQDGLAGWIANISYTATLNSFAQLELCLFDQDVRAREGHPPSS